MPETNPLHAQLLSESAALRQRVADLLRTQQGLEERAVQYEFLAEHATDVIWVRDMQLRLSYISPAVARQRGYSVEEVMAQAPLAGLTPDSREAARQAYVEALACERRGEELPERLRKLEFEVAVEMAPSSGLKPTSPFCAMTKGGPSGCSASTATSALASRPKRACGRVQSVSAT